MNNIMLCILLLLLLFFSCKNERITKEYYSDGNLKKEIYYSNSKLIKILDYYSSGAVYSCSKYTNYENGDCAITIYSQEGKVTGLMNYKGGVKNGEFIWYDNKGQILNKEIYRNGVLVK